ncbi:MAG: cytochrome C [Thermodesulfobacteriota bacterium]
MYRLAIVTLAMVVLAAPAAAFHDGGVGECTGCHAMHRPNAGTGGAGAGDSILLGSDPGSTCLKCHQASGGTRPDSHLVATADEDMPQGIPPVQLPPGGDFGWLKKSYRWGPGEGEAGGDSPAELHGHNIVAADFRFSADARRATAPGGTFPAARLSCISCHDPHGKYRRLADGSIGTAAVPIRSSGSYSDSPDPAAGNAVGVYRLLGGKGYVTSLFDGAPFVSDPPAAVAPVDYNRTEERGEIRVAYGRGMSEWCGNCHAALLGGTGGGKAHPAGNHVKFTQATAGNYNAYVASGNLTGSPATSYSSMVPFETGTADYAALKGTVLAGGAGPNTSSNVMCLSCHRAHASGWDHATRWNMKAEFLVYNGDYPGIDAGGVPSRISQGRTRAEVRKTFGDRPATAYASYQRSLCNKCHARD